MIPRMALFVARMALTAWVGAAVLFVIVGVREVTSPDFSGEVKDRLVALRFPIFYAAGFVLVGAAWISTALSNIPTQLSRPNQWLVLALVSLVLAGMIADYLWIYQPLRELVTPPGQPRTQRFVELHRWSARVNTIQLVLCLIAATRLNWTARPGQGVPSESEC